LLLIENCISIQSTPSRDWRKGKFCFILNPAVETMKPQMNTDEHGFCGPDSGFASRCSGSLSSERILARDKRGSEYF
jgi:hypothetical protein